MRWFRRRTNEVVRETPREVQQHIASDEPLIDVRELIKKFPVAELNEAADLYWQRARANPQIAAKPFTLGVVEHSLPQLGFLIQGLHPLPGMTVLDFGAGTCFASRMLRQLGLRVISVDVSKTALDIGRELDERWPPISDVPEHIFSLFDGVHLDIESETVDRIFCLDALHHVADQDAVLHEMARVLKDGGIAGFCEPGPQHSKSPEAQFEMRHSKVIENDIVLPEIFSIGQRYGFTDLRVAVATIHPPFVALGDMGAYFAEPRAFVNSVWERCSNFPIFFLYKGQARNIDSRDRAELRAQLTVSPSRLVAKAGERVFLSVDAVNSSPKAWLKSGMAPGSVNIGAMLRSTAPHVSLAQAREHRFELSRTDVLPGSVVGGAIVELMILEPGDYELEVDLVSELVCWFGSQSPSAVRVQIRIEP